ncbi:MAG TPA: Gfo/Idh/MocA family oxidoreductase [Opitutus sp.]|nr:Gfo/Idh/MocA family oxidoreductase [Opitutus sp.]
MPDSPTPLTRRDFLVTGAKLGAAILAAPYIARAAGPSSGGTQTLNVALIGCGEEGRVLLNAALKIPDIRFRAVCDIWDYNRTYGQRLLEKFGHDPKPFEDYQEMLSSVPDLDAVIVATPDFMHAEHTNACLHAGHHVYCEKLMSNTAEGARSMVRTARETKKLLQIGHQRRSNPRYQYARDRIVYDHQLLGRVTNAAAQWNRAVTEDLGWPRKFEMPEAKLHRYGYADMHQFRNWRWFKKYAGGPISDLGAHQIDVFNWFLKCNPRSVLAGGGVDYYTTHEWYDNVTAIYEFPTDHGIVRSTYGVLTTTSAGGGYHETFMGDEGSLKMSENPKYTKLYREARAPDWEHWANDGLIKRSTSGEGAPPPVAPWEKPRPSFSLAPPRASVVDVRETAALSSWDMPVTLDKAIHQPHLENFFDAIRNGTPLNCPGEVGLATCVTVLRVNESVAAQKMLHFAPEDFTA